MGQATAPEAHNGPMRETGSNGIDPAADRAASDGDEHETGGELVLEEAREEVSRLVTHPVTEIRRLEHVADEGESPATPLIVAVGVAVFLAIVLAIVLTVILLVYYNT